MKTSPRCCPGALAALLLAAATTACQPGPSPAETTAAAASGHVAASSMDAGASTAASPPPAPASTAVGSTNAGVHVPDAPLLVPVEGVTPQQLVDTFEQARSEGGTHEAIDILAPRGTPVRAVADGRVVKLFTSKPGGLTVYQFDRSERFAYYYAHLDAYAPGLQEGQVLRRGDVLGTVGFTGNASPQAPHLHFAVFVLGPEKRWWEGTAINPYPLLRPAPGR